MRPEDGFKPESRLDELLRRAIVEMPAPEVDLAPLVLARIEARPSPLTLALQLGVLAVLVLSAASLIPWSEAPLRWPDLSAGLEVSTRVMAWIHALAVDVGSVGRSLPEAGGRSLELASAALVGLVLLNLRVAWRPAAEGGRR